VNTSTDAEEEYKELYIYSLLYSDCWTCSKLSFQLFTLHTIVKKKLKRGSMVYKIIPLSSDVPATSQADILENFNQLNLQIGTEHTALNAAINNGLHKCVTLVRTPGAAAPTGTNVLLSQEITGGTPYQRFLDAAGQTTYIPVRHQAWGINVPAGTNNVNLIDVTTILTGSHSAGTIFVSDDLNRTRMVYSPYIYIGGTLSIPVGSCQLFAGATFPKVMSSGTFIQLEVVGYPAGGTTVTLIITESFV